MKIFFDTEFTGLHQHTTLISIGMVAENGREFYAEFTDYDRTQVDSWIQENVIANLMYEGSKNYCYTEGAHVGRLGDSSFISAEIKAWLSRFNDIEFWSDCLSFDWVLLNGLIATYENGYPQLPVSIASYAPFDIVTLLHANGHGYDVKREKFAGLEGLIEQKHNALWDANVIKACYEKLMNQ